MLHKKQVSVDYHLTFSSDMIPGLVPNLALFHQKKKMQFLPGAGPNLEVVVLTFFETI